MSFICFRLIRGLTKFNKPKKNYWPWLTKKSIRSTLRQLRNGCTKRSRQVRLRWFQRCRPDQRNPKVSIFPPTRKSSLTSCHRWEGRQGKSFKSSWSVWYKYLSRCKSRDRAAAWFQWTKTKRTKFIFQIRTFRMTQSCMCWTIVWASWGSRLKTGWWGLSNWPKVTKGLGSSSRRPLKSFKNKEFRPTRKWVGLGPWRLIRGWWTREKMRSGKSRG